MKKILVMEDHEMLRDTIHEILADEGYELLMASDGLEGVIKAKDFKPDLILSDIMMPKLDGFGAFQVLNAYGIITHDKVLYLSAFADATDEYKKLGFTKDDIMSKPFKIEELLAAIKKKLDQAIDP